MSVRMHRSSDGMMRPCDAKTPESCRAVAPDGSPAKHYVFDSPQAGNQWNSLAIVYSSIPMSGRRSEPAIALLTAMSDLQNGGKPATAQELAVMLEAASVQQAGSHNSLGKTSRGDATDGQPASSAATTVAFTDEETDSMLDAAEASGTGSPKMDMMDLSAFASKLKTDGYSREMDEDYPYSVDGLEDKVLDMMMDDNYSLSDTVASTGSYVFGVSKNPEEEVTEAICAAYEKMVSLDSVLPLNARRDLRRIASKWAYAAKTNDVTLADKMNMTYSHVRKTLDEYSVIIDGLSPVINSRDRWTNRSWQAKQRAEMDVAAQSQ